MKVVDLKTFQACKPGTLFHFYQKGCMPVSEEMQPQLCVKGYTKGEEDLPPESRGMEVYYVGLTNPHQMPVELSLGDQVDAVPPEVSSDFSIVHCSSDMLFVIWEPKELRQFSKMIGACARSAAREPMVVPIGQKEEKKTRWAVDEWLDYGHLDCTGDPSLSYVHFFFTLHRMPSNDKSIHSQYTNQFKLYADYQDQTWEITGASRLGDVYLKRLGSSAFYDHRVALDFEKFSNWRRELGEVQENPASELVQELVKRDREYHNTWVDPRNKSASVVKTSGRHYKSIGVADLIEGAGMVESDHQGIKFKDGVTFEDVKGQKLYIRTK